MTRLSQNDDEGPSVMTLEQTADYEIVVEWYASQRSLTGTEAGYAVRNRKTRVVEARFNAYAEALQGLPQIQENFDRFMGKFVRDRGGLN